MADPITLALCSALLWPNAEQVKDCHDWLPVLVVRQMCVKERWVYQECAADGTLCYCPERKFIKEDEG